MSQDCQFSAFRQPFCIRRLSCFSKIGISAYVLCQDACLCEVSSRSDLPYPNYTPKCFKIVNFPLFGGHFVSGGRPYSSRLSRRACPAVLRTGPAPKSVSGDLPISGGHFGRCMSNPRVSSLCLRGVMTH